MEHSLLCPNQARMNGVIIDDVPKFLDHRKESKHAIAFPDSGIVIPLSMMGPISYLRVRYPSAYELDTCLDVHLTGDTPWNPGSLDAIDRGVCLVASFLANNHFNSCDFDADYCSLLRINGIRSTNHCEVLPEHLANLWQISVDVACRTLESTTQDSIQVLEGKLHRRVRTRAHQRRYNQLGGYLGMFASDTSKANVKSLRGNQYIQHFCNRGNYAVSYPIKLKLHANHALDRFIHEVGVPVEMLTDGALELHKVEWGKICQKHEIFQTTTEPHSPWQNPSELSGGIIKRKVRQLMCSTNSPVRLCNYCW
mmetsp:Transcript_10258/g.14493  ORF Transcript_10258/g.14493 Transcript_10258/m.14493 type:complete len:310 (+) Transcript_10258:634-1563(+)